MLKIFDFIRDINFITITIRLCCAVICGGIIGIEREYKRRPAGFRTHILICLGAAMTTLTSQYLFLIMHYYTDIARLGAQVIAGIGFIGAGTIIVTKRKRVKGLTTAAGLWVSAIIGLVCGAGFIECALLATVMVMFAETVLVRIEYFFADTSTDVNLFIEYEHADIIEKIIIVAKGYNVRISDMEITRVTEDDGNHHYCAILYFQNAKRGIDKEIIKVLSEINGITSVEEL